MLGFNNKKRASLHPAIGQQQIGNKNSLTSTPNGKAKLTKEKPRHSVAADNRKKDNKKSLIGAAVNADFDYERSDSLSGSFQNMDELDHLNQSKQMSSFKNPKASLSQIEDDVEDSCDTDSLHDEPETRKVTEEEDVMDSSGGSYNNQRKSREIICEQSQSSSPESDALSIMSLDSTQKKMLRGPQFNRSAEPKNVGRLSEVQRASILSETKTIQTLKQKMGGQLLQDMKRLNDLKKRKRISAANDLIGISQKQLKQVMNSQLQDAIAPVQEQVDCESGSGDDDPSSGHISFSSRKAVTKRKSSQQNQKILKDVLAILGHKGIRVREEVVDESEKEKSCFDSFVISNENLFAQVWPTLAIILSLTSSLHYAYAAAFIDEVTEQEREEFYRFDLAYNIIFAFDLVLQFFFEYHDPSTDAIERRFKALAKRYLKGSFTVDFLTVLPLFRLLQDHMPYARLLFMMKLTRLYRGIQLLNTAVILQQLKNMVRRRIERIIQTDKSLSLDRTQNNNFISQIVLFGHFVSITKLIIIMSCVSYLFGIAWYIFTSIELDTVKQYSLDTGEEEPETFKTFFSLVDQEPAKNYVTMFYFAFTSLSTVGLGDYHPRSDIERLVGALALLCGVTITSYVMENITQATRQIQTFLADHEDGQMLSTFLNTMEKFNEGIPLDPKLSKEITDYFEYRWKMDRSFCFHTTEDQFMLSQMPTSIQRRIFMEFAFDDFLVRYQDFFKLKYPTAEQANVDKSIDDAASAISRDSNPALFPIDQSFDPDQYQALVILILRQLEPKYVESAQIFLHTQQVCDEITFLIKPRQATELYDEVAAIEVGYNHHQYIGQQFLFEENNKGVASILAGLEKHNIKRFHYPVRLTNFPVGALEIMFDQRSQFEYKASRMSSYFDDSRFHMIDCLFIRRRNWKLIQNQAEEEVIGGTDILRSIEKSVLNEYIKQIFQPIQQYREELIEKMLTDQKDKLKSEVKEVTGGMSVVMMSPSPAAFPKQDSLALPKIAQTSQKVLLLNPRRASFLTKGLERIEESNSSVSESISASSSSGDILVDKKSQDQSIITLEKSLKSLQQRPARRSVLVAPMASQQLFQGLKQMKQNSFRVGAGQIQHQVVTRKKSSMYKRLFADLEAGTKILNLNDHKGQESFHDALASSARVQKGVQDAVRELQRNNESDYIRRHSRSIRLRNSSSELVIVPEVMQQLSNAVRHSSAKSSPSSVSSDQTSDDIIEDEEEELDIADGCWDFQIRDLSLLNLIKEHLGEQTLHPQDRRILKELQPDEESQESEEEQDVMLEQLKNQLEYQEELMQSVIKRFDRAMDQLTDETKRRMKLQKDYEKLQKRLRDVLAERKTPQRQSPNKKSTKVNNYQKMETKTMKSMRRSNSSDMLGAVRNADIANLGESLQFKGNGCLEAVDLECVELPPASETKAEAVHATSDDQKGGQVDDVDIGDLPDMQETVSVESTKPIEVKKSQESSDLIDADAMNSDNKPSVSGSKELNVQGVSEPASEQNPDGPGEPANRQTVDQGPPKNGSYIHQMPCKPFMPLKPRPAKSKKTYSNLNHLRMQAPAQDDAPNPLLCSSPAIAQVLNEVQEPDMVGSQAHIKESLQFMQDNNAYPELSQAFSANIKDQQQQYGLHSNNLDGRELTIPDDLPSGSWRNSVNSAGLMQLKNELARAYENQ